MRQKPHNSQFSIEREQNQKIDTTDFKTYYKATGIIKAVWY